MASSRAAKQLWVAVEDRMRTPPTGYPALTEAQMSFAERGGVLIAGPGSGKTTTMGWALHFMLRRPGAVSVWVLSFTIAACREFAVRLQEGWPGIELLPGWEEWCRWHLRTIHSLARTICRELGHRPERRPSKMVREALRLIEKDPDKSAELCGKWCFIADEGQDSEPVQLSLLLRLASMGIGDALVGDPRQSIFQFTGVRPQAFDSYIRDRGDRYFLLENFRSSPEIVAFVNHLVRGPYDFPSVTGGRLRTYLEQLPAQVPTKPRGPRPEIRHIPFLSAWHLRHHRGDAGSSVVEDLKRMLQEPAIASLACIVRTQNEMDVLHQNLSILCHVPCVPLCSALKLGYAQVLPKGLQRGSIVQLVNVHVAKGQQFDFVLYIVHGYASTQARDEDFLAREEDHVRTEELHLHIVAASRAKRRLVVLIVGAVAPSFLEAALSHDSVVYFPPEEKFLQPTDRASKPRRNDPSIISVGALLEKGACEGLLVHTQRGLRDCQGVESRHDPTKTLAGSLADETVPLQTAAVNPQPSNTRLSWHGVAGHFGRVVGLTMQYSLCGIGGLRQMAKDVLDEHDKLPLREWEGEEFLLPKTAGWRPEESTAERWTNFVHALTEYLLTPSLSSRGEVEIALGSSLIGPQAAHSQKGKKLVRCLEDYVLLGDDHRGDYCIGSPGAVTLKRAADRLQRLEPLSGKTGLEIFNLIFRRRSRLDCKAAMHLREQLVTTVAELLEEEAPDRRHLGSLALLQQMAREDSHGDTAALRPLPPLLTQWDRLKLDLEDFWLDSANETAVREQATALRELLGEYHTEAELRQMEMERSIHLDVGHITACIPACQTIRAIAGVADIWVPGRNGATVLEVKAKSETTLEDEGQLLAYASAGASRAFLVDTVHPKLLEYRQEPHEWEETQQALLRGLAEASAVPRNIERDDPRGRAQRVRQRSASRSCSTENESPRRQRHRA